MKLTIELDDLAARRLLASLGGSNLGTFAVPIQSLVKHKQAPEVPTDRRHQQGTYVGLIRHLSPESVARVKARYKRLGLSSAIKLAHTLHKQEQSTRRAITNGSPRHRTKCAWCTRGFLAKRTDSRFCSKRCRDHQYRHRVKTEPSPLLGVEEVAERLLDE